MDGCLVLAIDPGACSGWALFETKSAVAGRKSTARATGGRETSARAGGRETSARAGGRLVGCGLDGGWLVAAGGEIGRVIIERPHSGRGKAPVRDVITLAIRAGEWGGAVRALGIEPEYLEPQTWKGQLSKERSHVIIWSKLSPEEKAVVDAAGRGIAPSKRHNMMDAVGIGLFYAGR